MTIDQIENEYKTSPSDANYQMLDEYSKANRDYSLSSFLLTATPSDIRLASHYNHLAETFLIEGRYLEASYFCKLWRAASPTAYSPWQLTAIIAAKRCDFSEMKLAVEQLKNLQSPANIQNMALTLYCLVFTNGAQTEECALAMLSSGIPSPIIINIAIDAGLRTSSFAILSKALEIPGSLLTFSPNGINSVLNIFRKRLLHLMKLSKESI